MSPYYRSIRVHQLTISMNLMIRACPGETYCYWPSTYVMIPQKANRESKQIVEIWSRLDCCYLPIIQSILRRNSVAMSQTTPHRKKTISSIKFLALLAATMVK